MVLRTPNVFTGYGKINRFGFSIQVCDSEAFIEKVAIDLLRNRGLGSPATNYKLRDWLFQSAKILGRAVPHLA